MAGMNIALGIARVEGLGQLVTVGIITGRTLAGAPVALGRDRAYKLNGGRLRA